MRMTADQVKSFFYDDTAIANTDEFELIHMNTEIYGSDDSKFTLVVAHNGHMLMGETMVFGSNESGYDWPSNFDGIELKPCKETTVSKKVWTYL